MVSTPAEHHGSRITTAGALMDTAAARPATDQDTKRREFGEAWRIALPQLRALAKRALGGNDLIDDVLSYTAQKLWRAVQTGYTPRHGYEAILPGTPRLAAATILTRNQKHRDNPALSLDAHRDTDEERDNWMATHDDDSAYGAIDNVADTELRTRLDRAARRARLLGHPLAARILTHGIDDTPAATARHLDADTKDITTALEWIQAHHYALLTTSDTRFTEHLEDTVGGVQLDLFRSVMGA